MAEPTTDEARDVRGLLHLAGTYATRAVAAAEAMEVAFDVMVREAGVNDIGDPPGPQPNDWAKRVQALAAASRACGELARTRLLLAEAEQEMTYDDWATFELIARKRDQLKVWLPTIAEQAIDLYAEALGDATHEQARARALTEVAEGISSVAGDPDLGGTIAYVAHPPGADPMAFKPEDVTVVRADHEQAGPLDPIHKVIWDDDYRSYQCVDCGGMWPSVAEIPNLGCPEPEQAGEVE